MLTDTRKKELVTAVKSGRAYLKVPNKRDLLVWSKVISITLPQGGQRYIDIYTKITPRFLKPEDHEQIVIR